MFDFDKHLADIADQTVLCIGDLMLDEFVYGEVTRISPEAPAPVIAAKRSETMIGGAGNVARNLVSLGARCIFVGLVGDDDAGRTLKKALAKQRRIDARLVVDKSRQTTRKVRFVSEHFSTHLLRADWESASQVNRKAEAALIGHIAKAMKKADAVVLSDYAKGTLTGRVVRAAIRGCAQGRQAGDRRSEGPRLRRLPRRDADYAEPAGIGGGYRVARPVPTRKSSRRRRHFRVRSAPRPCSSPAAKPA